MIISQKSHSVCPPSVSSDSVSVSRRSTGHSLSLTWSRLLSQGQFEGVESGAERVGHLQPHVALGDLLRHHVDDQLGGEHPVTGSVLQHLRLEVLVQRLGALHQFYSLGKAPEDLEYRESDCEPGSPISLTDRGGAGMGPEAHQDVFRLPGLYVVESLGVISCHRLELNVQLQTNCVLLLGEIILCEATVLHTADQSLPIVAGLGGVLELLHLPHAPVLLGLGRQVLHQAGVGVLPQPPAELDGGPGPVRDTRHLQYQILSITEKEKISDWKQKSCQSGPGQVRDN